MSLVSATLAGRRAAESLMLDAGTALRPYRLDAEASSGPSYDPVSQEESGEFDPSFVLASRCKVQARNVQPRESEVGGRTSVTVRTELHLPADTDPLEVGDVWEITAAHPLSLSTVGQRLRVTAPVAGTLKTARRYEVEEMVS